jgi:hypothetical protein
VADITSRIETGAFRSAKPYRVLHGVTGAAGQANALAGGLRQYGVYAENLLIGESRYGFKADHQVPATHRDMSNFLVDNIDRFDIFHFHFRPAFYEDSKRLRFPSFADLPILKAAGKRIIFHFRGSEIRSNAEFAKKSPYNYVDDGEGARLSRKFPDETKTRVLELVRAGADAVLANDPEIASYIGQPCHVVNRLVADPKDQDTMRGLEKPLKSEGRPPLILHAPSRRGIKGTEWVFDAIESLRNDGVDFEFEVVEGLSHEEAMKRYAEADIIIDQLRIGWYGVLSVEAMALGKTVLCYIRDDLRDRLNPNPPLVMTTRETLEHDLRDVLHSPDKRKSIGETARRYYEATHRHDSVIPGLISIYDEVWAASDPVDPRPFLKLLADQFDLGVVVPPPPMDVTAQGYFPETLLGKAAYLLESEGMSGLMRRIRDNAAGRVKR